MIVRSKETCKARSGLPSRKWVPTCFLRDPHNQRLSPSLQNAPRAIQTLRKMAFYAQAPLSALAAFQLADSGQLCAAQE